jgi:hypothetical protein
MFSFLSLLVLAIIVLFVRRFGVHQLIESCWRAIRFPLKIAIAVRCRRIARELDGLLFEECVLDELQGKVADWRDEAFYHRKAQLHAELILWDRILGRDLHTTRWLRAMRAPRIPWVHGQNIGSNLVDYCI